MSSTENVNYSSVIADLEKKKFRIHSEYKDKIEKINAAIEGVKQLLSDQDRPKTATADSGKNSASNAPFENLGVTEAILKLFNTSNQAYTAKEIEGALLGGGVTSKSKKLYATIFTTLRRIKKQGLIEKVRGGKWKIKGIQPVA